VALREYSDPAYSGRVASPGFEVVGDSVGGLSDRYSIEEWELGGSTFPHGGRVAGASATPAPSRPIGGAVWRSRPSGEVEIDL